MGCEGRAPGVPTCYGRFEALIGPGGGVRRGVVRRGRPGTVLNSQDQDTAGGRSIASTMELWPGLLALAVALNLTELILRKGKSLFGRA